MTTRAQAQAEQAVRSAKIRKVSIIGAGVMGCEIAAANLRAGLDVTISDINTAKAAEAVSQILRSSQTRAVPSPHFMPNAAHRPISVASSDAELADADLIIEAVPEEEHLKTAILARVEPLLREHAILASNSSSIPMTQLATSLRNPGRLCGLHFCHPVSERPLVEVIGADVTAPATLSCAFDYVQTLGLVPIILKDRPGFLLNRLLVPYLNEALELVLEGVGAETLDQAALDFGMPMGPLRHIDEFGIDVAIAVGRTLFRAFPDRIVPSELLIAMYKAKRLGSKTGKGFYESNNKAESWELSPHVLKMIEDRQRPKAPLTPDDVSRRLFLPLLLEGMRAIEENFVDDPGTIDAALRNGLGMTRAYPGLFAWADSISARSIVKWLEPLAPLGKRFEPTPSLRKLAAENASFHGSMRLLG